MEVYKTRCDLCPSEFNTTTELLKHREKKHSGAKEVSFLPFYDGQKKMVGLLPEKKKGRRPASYKQWLHGIVDSIMSCLHPKARGK